MPTTTWAISKDGVLVKDLKLSTENVARVSAYAGGVRANSILMTPAVIENGVIVRPAVMRDPTPADAIALQAEDFFNGFLKRATAGDREQAAKAAAVQPITPAEYHTRRLSGSIRRVASRLATQWCSEYRPVIPGRCSAITSS